VCVIEDLAPFLPRPIVAYDKKTDTYLFEDPAHSIGRVRSWYGNFAVMVRAYAYIRALGADGLRATAEQAVLSANYLRVGLADTFAVPFETPCMHEFVLSGEPQRKRDGVRTLDMAKRLLDYGFHPPTVYFPLIVEEAMMIEPTETEPLAMLDEFVAVMKRIAEEAACDPEILHDAPHFTPVRRLDEAAAARNVDVADLE
jgi:glycine dehydrogenase subunit 2